MTPEQLIESVADKLYSQFKPHTSSGHCDYVAKEMLRIVLEAIERGEVVDSKPIFNGCDYQGAEIVFKPEFKELLNK